MIDFRKQFLEAAQQSTELAADVICSHVLQLRAGNKSGTMPVEEALQNAYAEIVDAWVEDGNTVIQIIGADKMAFSEDQLLQAFAAITLASKKLITDQPDMKLQ